MSDPSLRPWADAHAASFGTYLTVEEMRKIKKGNKFDILHDDDCHYQVEVKAINEGIVHLHYLFWSKNHDFQGPLECLYLAELGRYTSSVIRNNTTTRTKRKRPIDQINDVDHTTTKKQKDIPIHFLVNSSSEQKLKQRLRAIEIDNSELSSSSPSMSNPPNEIPGESQESVSTTIQRIDTQLEVLRTSVRQLRLLEQECKAMKENKKAEMIALINERDRLCGHAVHSTDVKPKEEDTSMEGTAPVPALPPSEQADSSPSLSHSSTQLPQAQQTAPIQASNLDEEELNLANDPNEYEVEALIGHLGNPSKKTTMRFHVRWKGYDPSHDLWLPYKDVKDLVAMDEYMVKHPELRLRLHR